MALAGWQAGLGIQDTTAAFGAALPRVLERSNLGHLHFRTRRLKNSRSAFWSHVVPAMLANLSSGPKRRSLRHGVTNQGQAAKASKGRAERSVADFPHPEAVQGSNNAQRPATKLHSRLFGQHYGPHRPTVHAWPSAVIFGAAFWSALFLKCKVAELFWHALSRLHFTPDRYISGDFP